MDYMIAALLELVNETLASAIVIIAASILLYNLTRNLNDRVARTSAIVLGCMTVVYIGDVFISLGPGAGTYAAILRLQWIGIAFMPVAMLHLSDALLATTGLPSRGRRRRIIRVLYIISAGFLLSAAFSNWLIVPIQVFPTYFTGADFVSLQAGPLFPLYVAYFLIVTGVAFINVGRAKQRCLTRSTRRRMGYLQFALLTPAIGIFPFSILLGAGQEYTLAGLLLVNLANIVVILMLLFLAYPLSFFGSRVPDRVVKSELLRFFLRGPATGLIALVVILYTAPATRILGIPGQDFMPFAVVAVVLLWQWFVALALPYLEKWLVFSGEDRERLDKLQYLSERLLTRGDLLQLLEATLAATCDYLRVNTAFVVSFNGAGTNGSEPELVAAIGPARPAMSLLISEEVSLRNLLDIRTERLHLQAWQGFWILPLFKTRAAASPNQLIGFMGIQARSAVIDLTDDDLEMLESFAHRAAQTLDDLALQAEIIAALEGLLPQINITPATRDRLEYRQPRVPVIETAIGDPEQFKEQVRAALRHYWGGPGLTNSRLLELNVVRQALAENDNNPTRALRSVLLRVIEAQRPEGERKLLSPEWTIYNILEMRYLKGAKVKEVVSRLAMSEPDLYRKQRIAIDAVAETLIELEQASLAQAQNQAAAPIEDADRLPSQP
jgi:hypothetical protein